MYDLCISLSVKNTEPSNIIRNGSGFDLVFKMLAHAHWRFCVHILFTFGQPQAHYYMTFDFDTLVLKIVKWI